MSKVSPISIRIASGTRHFETTGDSSYFYSSNLVTNLSFLKAIKKLGQQLGWPVKGADKYKQPKQDNDDFLAKANKSIIGLRIEHLVMNFQSTPCKQWVSANKKMIDKLTTCQEFFYSKAIGFLAKSLGYVANLNPEISGHDVGLNCEGGQVALNRTSIKAPNSGFLVNTALTPQQTQTTNLQTSLGE